MAIVNATLIPRSDEPATNKTWPANWYWFNVTKEAFFLKTKGVVPGSGYYLVLHTGNQSVRSKSFGAAATAAVTRNVNDHKAQRNGLLRSPYQTSST
ncbi:hypothetical protein Q8F55_008290 [Vanrija albida]|uniref:Uncharacterized protein n=1 Tax=Vanrija albida TaxID=181172 RepID=A0ABR3PVX3_9TREE